VDGYGLIGLGKSVVASGEAAKVGILPFLVEMTTSSSIIAVSSETDQKPSIAGLRDHRALLHLFSPAVAASTRVLLSFRSPRRSGPHPIPSRALGYGLNAAIFAVLAGNQRRKARPSAQEASASGGVTNEGTAGMAQPGPLSEH
jgi:hypothetical protein